VGQVENLRAGWQPALSDAPNCSISSAVLVAAMLLRGAVNFASPACGRFFHSFLASDFWLRLCCTVEQPFKAAMPAFERASPEDFQTNPNPAARPPGPSAATNADT
jgi:hypothetical protein